MATVEIVPSLFNNADTIDLDAIRDVSGSFSVFFAWNESVTGFTASDITLTNATGGTFRGSGCSYEYVITPTGANGDAVTVAVAADAVTEGNSATTLMISHTDDTISFTELFDTSMLGLSQRGIAVSPTRIYVSFFTSNNFHIRSYQHDGTLDNSESLDISITTDSTVSMNLDWLNGRVIVSNSQLLSGVYTRHIRWADFANNQRGTLFEFIDDPTFGFDNSQSTVAVPSGITHNDYGIIGVIDAGVGVFPYDGSSVSDARNITIDGVDFPNIPIVANGNRIYASYGGGISVYRFSSDTSVEFEKLFTITASGSYSITDFAIYNDTIYLLNGFGGLEDVRIADLPVLDPPIPKFRTAPLFVREGDTLNLKTFAEGAEKVIWDIDYALPSYLSITDSTLTIASGVITDETFVQLRLRALNVAGSTTDNAISFYLVIRRNVAPVWSDTTRLTIGVGSEVDLFDLVPDASTIGFRTGFAQSTGTTLVNGRFSVDTTADSVFSQWFTASRGSLTSDRLLRFSVVNTAAVTQYADTFRYRVEIADIDVTDDLVGDVQISQSLDAITVTNYVIGDCTLSLKNDRGKYSEGVSGNFWGANSLEPNGYFENITVYAELYSGGTWHPKLVFAGIILETNETGSRVAFQCVDSAYLLRNQDLYDIGNRKYAHVFAQDEESYQGEYTPERTLLPILPSAYKTVGGATDLTIRETQNPSEGVPVSDTNAYVDNAGIFTEGGLRDDNALLLRYKTAFRDIGIKHLVRELMRQTGLASQIDLLAEVLSEPYHLNYGNIGFQSNATRVIRTPSDWVYDDTNAIFYILMSNYQNHIADQLVEYDVVADRSRVVFEFPAEYFCVNIATSDFDTFYVLTAGAADYDRLRDTGRAETQDRFLAYDSTVTGHENRILDLDISTGTLSVHVDTNNAYPPQVGLHYHAGFENIFYADDWRGIVPENRATFEVRNNLLYYRYAKAGEFGVARVNAGGTTASLIDNTVPIFGLYVVDNTGNEVFVVPVNSPNNSTAVALRRFNLPSGLTTPFGIVIDGNDLYVVDNTGGEVFVVPADTGTPYDPNDIQTAVASRRFNLPSGLTNPSAMTIDGNDLYIADAGGDEVFVVPADTANNQTAVASRRFDLPSGLTSSQSMTIDGNDLYIAKGGSGYEVYVLPANTPNNQTATTTRRFNVLSGLLEPGGMTIDGNNLYISDGRTDDVFVVPADTVNNGTAVVSRQFNLPSGLTNPQGMTIGTFRTSDLVFNNHLNFDFTINSAGEVFIVLATGDPSESTLFVKRWSSGTVTTLFTDRQLVASLTVLQPTGGYYLGVHEVIEQGGDLYAVVPIQRAFSVEGQTVSARIPRNAAGAVLYKIDVVNDTLTAVKTYDFVTESCRSLTVHDNAVHFVESPSVAYRYKPINSELDSFNDNLGYNPIDTDGALYQINASDNPVHLGRVWFGDEDYRGTPCKALSAAGDLNMVVGSDDPQNILATNAKASDPANMLWVQRTNRLQYRLEDFGAGGSVYSALTNLALKTGSLLTTSQDLITLRDRDPFTATQDAAIGVTLPYQDANKVFPTSGYLLIHTEIIRYTGRTTTAFTGLTRGVLGSMQTTRTDAPILYCDNVLYADTLRNPYIDVGKANDVNNLYNVVTDSNQLIRVEDTSSVDAYGEKVYSLDLGLSRHQSAWIETVYNKYLETLKDIHSVYNCTLTQAFYLNLGEVVPLFHEDTPIGVRIVGLDWRGQTTTLSVRSV